jgi:hypothetical protein
MSDGGDVFIGIVFGIVFGIAVICFFSLICCQNPAAQNNSKQISCMEYFGSDYDYVYTNGAGYCTNNVDVFQVKIVNGGIKILDHKSIHEDVYSGQLFCPSMELIR